MCSIINGKTSPMDTNCKKKTWRLRQGGFCRRVIFVVVIKINLHIYLHNIEIINYLLIILRFCLQCFFSMFNVWFIVIFSYFEKLKLGYFVKNVDEFITMHCFEHFETSRNLWFSLSRRLWYISSLAFNYKQMHNKFCVNNKFFSFFFFMFIFLSFCFKQKCALYLQFSRNDSWLIIHPPWMFKNVKT